LGSSTVCVISKHDELCQSTSAGSSQHDLSPPPPSPTATCDKKRRHGRPLAGSRRHQWSICAPWCQVTGSIPRECEPAAHSRSPAQELGLVIQDLERLQIPLREVRAPAPEGAMCEWKPVGPCAVIANGNEGGSCMIGTEAGACRMPPSHRVMGDGRARRPKTVKQCLFRIKVNGSGASFPANTLQPAANGSEQRFGTCHGYSTCL
jgi:hypothetical protein